MLIKKWFFYFLFRAISQRKGRFVISTTAVVLAISVVTALVTLSSGVNDKIGKELRQYGANMIVTDKTGAQMKREIAESLASVSESIRDASLQVYGLAGANGSSIEVIAMERGKMTGFHVQGSLPEKDYEIMIGVDLQGKIGAGIGEKVLFENGHEFLVKGIFEKGTEEDSAVVIELGAAPVLLGTNGISAVLLNVEPGHLDKVREAIAGSYPGLDIKTVRQVAIAEERILGRMQLLIVLVTLAVVFASVIALGSTMSANVIERTEEIGLMKAIGAAPKSVRNFFVAEAGLAGAAGAAVGYVLGLGAAEAVSKAAFGSYVSVDLFFILPALALGICISVCSTFLPVRGAMKLVPAIILRGE